MLQGGALLTAQLEIITREQPAPHHLTSSARTTNAHNQGWRGGGGGGEAVSGPRILRLLQSGLN